jgi:hypothetical protein
MYVLPSPVIEFLHSLLITTKLCKKYVSFTISSHWLPFIFSLLRLMMTFRVEHAASYSQGDIFITNKFFK